MGSNPIGSIVKVLGFQHFFSVAEEGFRQGRDKPFLAKAEQRFRVKGMPGTVKYAQNGGNHGRNV